MTQRARPEATFQTQVIELARYYGYTRIYHPPDNLPVRARSGRTRRQNVAPGFPDLWLMRVGEKPDLVVAELKAEKGRVSPDQWAWIEGLRDCGLDVYVWRPRDWDQVRERFARGRRELEPFTVVRNHPDQVTVDDVLGGEAA